LQLSSFWKDSPQNGQNFIFKDSDYYGNIDTGGNIGISIWNTTDNPFVIEKGDRICQATFYTYLVADNDEPLSDERIGGFGSSKGHSSL